MAGKAKTQTDNASTDPVDALPTVTLSGAVSAVLSEAVETHRWQNRMTRADVLKEAVQEWADKRDLTESARARLAEKTSAAE